MFMLKGLGKKKVTVANFRKLATVTFFIICFAIAMPLAAAAEENAEMGYRHTGFFISPSYYSFSTPLFRQPAGVSELAINESRGGFSLMAGYEYSLKPVSLAARLAYWGGSFNGFSFPEMPNSPYPVYVKYADPKLSFYFLDILVGWIPDKAGMFTVYGLAGFGFNSESYTLSGSTFPDWNGAKSYSEFKYAYGLGVKVTPRRFVSVFAEFRLLPGITTMDLEFLYSDDGYDYYRITDTRTTHTTSVLFAGISINI